MRPPQINAPLRAMARGGGDGRFRRGGNWVHQAFLPAAVAVFRLDLLPRELPRWIEPTALAADMTGKLWIREDAETHRLGVLSITPLVVRRKNGYHLFLDFDSPFYEWRPRRLDDACSVPVSVVHDGVPCRHCGASPFLPVQAAARGHTHAPSRPRASTSHRRGSPSSP